MTDERCQTCVHWHPEYRDDGNGECGYINLGVIAGGDKAELVQQWVSGDANVSVVTAPDFGCVAYEPKREA